MTSREGSTVEYSPTWMVAVICAVIIILSLIVERLLHFAGKYFLDRDNKPLYGAVQKIKEELMLMGFISLFLTVFQDRIQRWCIPSNVAETWLPCKKQSSSETSNSTTTSHFQTQFFSSIHGRGLAESSADSTESYCQQMGKAPLLSLTAVHHLHIFIFVLALVHVAVCAMTILFGRLKIMKWKGWEKAIRDRLQDPENGDERTIGAAHGVEFLKRGAHGWIHSFFKQFYYSVTEAEYYTMRRGFILAHSREKPQFDFHGYIMRAFVDDFRKVIGINWFMWLFAVVFLLLNVAGFHTYFWVAFIPLLLLLAVGTKLEHVIAQLADDVAFKLGDDKNNNNLIPRPAEDVALKLGDDKNNNNLIAQLAEDVALKVGDDKSNNNPSESGKNSRIIDIKVSDRHFWFEKPKIVLVLIHVLLFQNSFEIAFFFWIWAQYGFRSCIMDDLHFLIPRLVLAVFIVFVCSYSTLPLYAIVTQMGSSYKQAILADYLKDKMSSWMMGARKRVKENKKSSKSTRARLWGSSSVPNHHATIAATDSSNSTTTSTPTNTATAQGPIQLPTIHNSINGAEDHDDIRPAHC